MGIKGYFCDIHGVIYTVADFYQDGTNAPYHIEIEGNTVIQCGTFSEGDGYPVDEEYTLWESLVDLAKAIEEK